MNAAPSTRAFMAALAVAAAGTLHSGSALVAHEIGTASVTATIMGTRYAVDIEAEAPSLLARLEARAGQPRSARLVLGQYEARFRSLQEKLLEHITLRFDGQQVEPHVERIDVRVEATTSPQGDSFESERVRVRLAGEVLQGARTLSWSFGLASVSYPFTVKHSDRRETITELVEGDRQSRPIPIHTSRADAPLRVAATYAAIALVGLYMLAQRLTQA